MSIQTEINTDNVIRNKNQGMNPFIKSEDKIQIVNLTSLIDRKTEINKIHFDITLIIFSKLKTHFDGYEYKNFESNYFELLEFVHSLVVSSISEYLKVSYTRIEDLISIDSNTIKLFLQPDNITEEEELWVDGFIKKLEKHNEVEVKIPIELEKNYYINIIRILGINNSNPTFNDSILDYFERLRNTNS
jgi:hypothetical protein